MKTNLKWAAIAACLAAAPAAMAQSSITIFGTVDLGIGHVNSQGGSSNTGMVSASRVSRLGFRGTEDLGGGMAAGFFLEGELQADTGTAGGFNFGRESLVTLSSRSWGEIRLGREYTLFYRNIINFDPTAQRGFDAIEFMGPAQGKAQSAGATFSYIRNSNQVTYLLPSTLGGVYGGVQYAFGENQSNTPTTATGSRRQGNYAGGRLGYTDGKLDVSATYADFQDVARTGAGLGDYKAMNAGIAYEFGFIKPALLYQRESLNSAGALPEFKFETINLGVTAQIGVGTFRASISRYNNQTANAANRGASKIGGQYIYPLSQRTALYVDVGRLKNRAGTTATIGGIGATLPVAAPVAGGSSTGYAVGVRHFF